MDYAPRYLDPPFRITRTSHVCLTVRDLDTSVAFYETLAGLVVTARDEATAWLRGIEEVAHHCLVLRRSDEVPSCDAIGFRVERETDLDAAAAHFGGAAERVERVGQGPTLLVSHPSGIRFELVAGMQVQPRILTDYPAHKGARALRLDHLQVIVPDVSATGTSFLDMGFRAAEVIADRAQGRFNGMFLHRKNNPHDLVLALGQGPRLHHFAVVVPDLQAMFRAADIAASLGMGEKVERGPGRHGPGNGSFVYVRDPDGHRIELIMPPMQVIDAEEPTRVWDAADKGRIVPWGGPASNRWREEATPFSGVPLSAEGALARWVAD